MRSAVDEELAEVLAREKDAPPPAPAAPAKPTSSRPKRNLGLLLALSVIAVLIGLLVWKSLNSAVVYARTVDQLLAASDKLTGRTVRVDGMLVHGSLRKRDNPCEYRFRLAKNGRVLDVHYAQCVIPDSLQDRPDAEIGVTAEGKLLSDGTFEASQIMAKCPSKYEEKKGQSLSPEQPGR